MTDIILRFQDGFAFAAFLEENKEKLLSESHKFSHFVNMVGIVTSACCDSIKAGRLKYMEEAYRELIGVIKGDSGLLSQLKTLGGANYLLFESGGTIIEKM